MRSLSDDHAFIRRYNFCLLFRDSSCTMRIRSERIHICRKLEKGGYKKADRCRYELDSL